MDYRTMQKHQNCCIQFSPEIEPNGEDRMTLECITHNLVLMELADPVEATSMSPRKYPKAQAPIGPNLDILA